MVQTKKIGDLIVESQIRNANNLSLELWGVSIDKSFIKSVANIIGTDLSKYKIVHKNQFVCSLMQVSRDEKIPIGLWKNENDIIVSPAYKVFEITESSTILPEYMNLWFMRSEFDREASYYGVGGVRGSLEWEDFCEMRIPVPSIGVQKDIVGRYQSIERRIAIKRQINDNLESQGFTLYREMFSNESECIDGKIIDLATDVVCGKTPSTKDESNFNGEIPFITIPDMHDSRFCVKTERYLSEKGATNSIPPMSICVSCIASAGLVCIADKKSQTNQQINSIICKSDVSPFFVYYKMKDLSDYIREIGSCGSTTCNLSKSGFSNIDILIPSTIKQQEFTSKITSIFAAIRNNQIELKSLEHLKSLLLCKLSY